MPKKKKKRIKSTNLEDNIDTNLVLPVHSTSAVIVTLSDRKMTVQKNQKRPTVHQLHLFTRLIDAEIRMLLRKGYFDDMDVLSVSYRIEKRSR